MEPVNSGTNTFNEIVHTLFGQTDWPEFIHIKFQFLQEQYPQCWQQVMAKAPELIDLNAIEETIHTDQRQNRLTIDRDQLRNVAEIIRSKMNLLLNLDTEEDSNAFGLELTGAILSAAAHAFTSSQTNLEVGQYIAKVLEDQAKLDEIAYGPNVVVERINKLVDLTLSGEPARTPPWIKVGIPISPVTYPYPISEDFNAKKCISHLHAFFYGMGRVDCSLDEFEGHMLIGDVHKKLTWKGRTIEIAWFHKLLTGDYEGVKGIKF
ncbi:MAG: hypothetical protein JNM00_10380, partial [Flavobacteriales bacterium]|nr:hypothetical protein [Flavobacteriales bacterium]